MKVSLKTLVELSALFTNSFVEVYHKNVNWEEMNGENSLLYSLVYGESPEQIGAIVPYIKNRDGFKCVEFFAGNGFESYLLAKKFPKVQFSCLDLVSSVNGLKRLSNVKHYRCDVLAKSMLDEVGLVDLIFVGGANASLCCLKTTNELDQMFKSMHLKTKKNATVVVSFFTDEEESSAYSSHYSVEEILYHGIYKGYTLENFTLYPYNVLDSSQQYLHLCALKNKKGIVERYLYNSEGYIYYSHTASVIKEIAEKNGFIFDKKVDRYLVFKK